MEIDTSLGHEQRPRGTEMKLAYLIAFFAATLSVIEIGAGKFRDREIVSVNKKMTAYGLYHTKVLKETLVLGERDLLEDLVRAGAIVPKDTLIIHHRLSKFDQELRTIRNQQNEIIHGSGKVDSANWSLTDINETLGTVKGIHQWEYEVEVLDLAGDNFDLSSLLLELCLVLGAIGLLTRSMQGRGLFQWLMVFFGLIGIGFGIYGYYLALSL